jgi:hypothetical protein
MSSYNATVATEVDESRIQWVKSTDRDSEYDKAKKEAYEGGEEFPREYSLRPKSMMRVYDILMRRPIVSHRLV